MNKDKQFKPREKVIMVRLTNEEYKQLERRAKSKRLSLSSFMRMITFEYLGEE